MIWCKLYISEGVYYIRKLYIGTVIVFLIFNIHVPFLVQAFRQAMGKGLVKWARELVEGKRMYFFMNKRPVKLRPTLL